MLDGWWWVMEEDSGQVDVGVCVKKAQCASGVQKDWRPTRHTRRLAVLCCADAGFLSPLSQAQQRSAQGETVGHAGDP